MLFLMREVTFNHLAQIDECLLGDQFSCKHIIKSRQYFLLNLTDSNIVIRLYPCQLLDWKIHREIDSHCARLAELLTYYLFTKFRQEVIGREAQPEFFPSVKILARLRSYFADWFAFARSVKVDDGKVVHLKTALGNVDKIGVLIAQALQCSIDFRPGNLRLRQLHRNALVFG